MKTYQVQEQKNMDENTLKRVDMDIPSTGKGEVLIKVSACGVCHTDLHIAEGDIHPPHLPVVPGHQIVGTIFRIGQDVRKWKIGDRVGLPWLYSTCGVCNYCLSGAGNLCPDARFTGFDVNGGFSEYVLADENFVLSIPEAIRDEQAAPLLCAGIIGYRSLKKADVSQGETLGLFGFGASAHLTIQIAKYWDCKVYVFTRSKEHQQHALELGAAWAGTADEIPPEKYQRAIIYAPVGYLVPQALEYLTPGGTLAINAIHMTNIPEMSYQLLYMERTLRSVANATYEDGIELLKLASEIPLKADVQLYTFDEVDAALRAIKHSKVKGEAVLAIQ